VGAGKWNLIKQFLGESIIISFMALLVALLMVDLVLPAFQNLTGQNIVLPFIGDWMFYGLIIIITFVLGFVSGSYPSFYLSAMPLVSMLRGKSGSGGNDTNLRRILVVVQFSIAIGLITSTLSINNQLNYMRNKSLGFQKEQIVILPINGGEFRSDIKEIMMLSPRNCLIRFHFPAPTTLRNPTSLARRDERAVDRFIKLIEAMSRIKIPIAKKI